MGRGTEGRVGGNTEESLGRGMERKEWTEKGSIVMMV